MALMKAAMAAVLVMEKEGITTAFGVPGAAINPLYAQLRERQSITHILARHVEGASHMAEGYTRAKAGNIGVCIGTSGPAGTDMITGLYSASADSIPILCILDLMNNRLALLVIDLANFGGRNPTRAAMK